MKWLNVALTKFNNEDFMRILCPNCKSKAIITSSHKQCETVTELYCICTDTRNCSATFVYSLAHKHYINPPMKTVKEIMLNLLRELPKNELNELLKTR